ncbi:MAG: hypothetical protein ACRDL7_11275 [Gaiellaceae bacterium]
MKATARRENPGIAAALWKGAKSGYHHYRADRYSAKAAQHRRMARNPQVIPGTATEIRYNRTGSQAGMYKHPFEQNVKMYALKNGSVLLKGRRRIHADDREPNFSRYVHPSHGQRRNPRMAKKDNTMMYLGLGLLAVFVLKPGAFGNLLGGAQDLHNMPAGTVWIDTTDGTMVVGPSIPGANWRLATQAEIQMAVVPA